MVLGSQLFTSGVLVHLGIFRVGEWDVETPKIVASYISVATIALFVSGNLQPHDYFMGVWAVAQGLTYHIAGIFTSMLIYRAFFHRLARYPGPFAARLSNFWITSRSMKKLHLYEEVQQLHRAFGDYVRVGKLYMISAWPGP